MRNLNDYIRKPVPKPQPKMDMDDQIKDILDCFNFKKVKMVMSSTNWNYAKYNHETGEITYYIPTLRKLKSNAKSLLKHVWEIHPPGESYSITATGGFEATCYESSGVKILDLKFVLTEWGLDYDIVLEGYQD
jgi:hypothetical protein